MKSVLSIFYACIKTPEVSNDKLKPLKLDFEDEYGVVQQKIAIEGICQKLDI